MKRTPQPQQLQRKVPQELNDSNFAAAIRSNRFYVVDAWANWCGPCRNMLPKFDELTAACARKDVTFAKVHVADPACSRLKEALKISSLPTFIIFKDGVEVGRKSGGDEVKAMAAWIDQYIGKPQ
nr:thioredoxin [Marseillevirus futianmevirus]